MRDTLKMASSERKAKKRKNTNNLAQRIEEGILSDQSSIKSGIPLPPNFSLDYVLTKKCPAK